MSGGVDPTKCSPEQYDQMREMRDNPGGEERDETPCEKLRRGGWALNSKCAKPMQTLPESLKKECHRISSKVNEFCENGAYMPDGEWMERLPIYQKMLDKQGKKIDDELAEQERMKEEHPQVVLWDKKQGKYIADEAPPKPLQNPEELRAELERSSGGGGNGLEEARARLNKLQTSVDMDALDDDNEAEGNETFGVALYDEQGDRRLDGADSFTIVTILDNDKPGFIGFD